VQTLSQQAVTTAMLHKRVVQTLSQQAVTTACSKKGGAHTMHMNFQSTIAIFA
jgi:hypothetical protein